MALFFLLACVAAAWSQEGKLTPRELFYAKPPVPASAATPQPERKPAARPKPRRKPAARPKPPAPGEAPAAPPARISGQVIPAAAVSYPPLGLRYSVMKGGQEVDPATVFHAGDRIRISVESNDAGYLYIVNQGSSGNWKLLFPSEEIAGGDNHVEPGRRYEIPAGYTFTFDEQPGVEKLFVILSRRPEGDLENLIYSLRQRPASAPARSGPKVLLAQNVRIDDSLIGRFRTYARDLVIEKVDEKTPGERKEKAVYTVNAAGGAGAHVVAELSLTHR